MFEIIWGHIEILFNFSKLQKRYRGGYGFATFVGLPASALLARLCVLFCKSSTNSGSPRAQPRRVASVKADC
jgi:hypothetical protein